MKSYLKYMIFHENSGHLLNYHNKNLEIITTFSVASTDIVKVDYYFNNRA